MVCRQHQLLLGAMAAGRCPSFRYVELGEVSVAVSQEAAGILPLPPLQQAQN